MNDSDSRKYIVDNLDKNIFVFAGAGSGKTTIMVDRMVSLVERKGADIISKICAITFTVNAASHFLFKFQNKLLKRSKMTKEDWEKDDNTKLPCPTDETRNNCKKALENLSSCFAGTIDSFINLIVSEYPLDSGVPSNIKLLEESNFSSVYNKELKLISENYYGDELLNKYNDFCSVQKNPTDTFERSIRTVTDANMLEIQGYKTKEEINIMLNELKRGYKDIYEKDFSYFKDHVSDLVDGSNKAKEANNKLKTRYLNYERNWNLSDLNYILDSIKNLKDVSGYDLDNNIDIVDFKLKRGKDYCIHDKDSLKINEFENKINEIIYAVSISFLADAARLIQTKLNKNGILTFNDYLKTFRNLLLKDMEDPNMPIINHIRKKYSIFLIDESQDTSPFQTDIFFMLASDKQAFNKKDCDLHPGSIFIVGDPKQSIYRFRGADIKTYNDTKSMFTDKDYDKKNVLVYLTENFRSTDHICTYFNDVFKNTFIDPKTLENSFIEIPTGKKDKLAIGKETGVFKYDSYIDVIKRITKNPLYTIKDKMIEYKDIMLITKNTPEQEDIINELNENNIPYFVEGKFRIDNNDALKCLYYAYAYVALGDTYAKDDKIEFRPINEFKYSLLSSNLFNVDGLDLSKRLDESDALNIIDKLDEIGIEKDKYNPVTLFDKIMEIIDIFKYLPNKNMEYIFYVKEKIIKGYNNGIICDYKTANDEFKNFINSTHERCPLIIDKQNAVHLANVHKVKGLEASVVILLPSKDKSYNSTLHFDYDDNKSYIFSVKGGEHKNSNLFSTNTFENKMNIEDNELLYEQDRLRYVAATRACNFLFIPKEAGYWDILLASKYVSEFEEKAPEKKKEDSEDSKIKEFKNNSQEFNKKSSYKIKRPSDDHSNLEELSKEGRNDDLKATTLGTVIHKLMEVLVNSKFKFNKNEAIEYVLKEEGIKEDSYKNVLENVYDVINDGGYKQYQDRFIKDIKNLLIDKECHCEMPFSYMDGNNIIQGIIDLLYIDNNVYHIVDYKTNYEPENKKGNIDWEKEYENQLLSYKKAIKAIYGDVKIETHIYHIDA